MAERPTMGGRRSGFLFAAAAIALAIAFTACVGEDPSASPGSGDGGAPVSLDPPGTKCTSGEQCLSKTCVDGYCCNTACAGQCETCSAPGKEGTCSFATGSPSGTRAACAGAGSCAGSCDGTKAECNYPSASIVCGAACDGTCDASGGCTSKTGGNCPDGFACGASACLTSCAKPGDCQPYFQCDTQSAKCVRTPESNCLDGQDNNGDGLADCADPTCNSLVECVPAPGANGEIGLLADIGPCPTNYEAETAFHSGLVASTCTGCTCQSTCSSTFSLWNTNQQCPATGAIVEVLSGAASGALICKNFPFSTTLYSTFVTAPTVNGCTGAGTAAQADPTWTNTKVFCAAKSTSTCTDATKRCVARTASKKCTRGAQADACPSGYTDDRDVMFSGYTKGSCTGGCSSCTGATNQCKHYLSNAGLIGDLANCQQSNLVDNNCKNLYGASYGSVGDAFFIEGGDNCKSNVTNVPPAETGAARFCCQP